MWAAALSLIPILLWAAPANAQQNKWEPTYLCLGPGSCERIESWSEERQRLLDRLKKKAAEDPEYAKRMAPLIELLERPTATAIPAHIDMDRRQQEIDQSMWRWMLMERPTPAHSAHP